MIIDINKTWNRYIRSDVNQMSKTTEWKSAQTQNAELMNQIPKGVKRVLDLGCGDGWTTNELIRRGYEVQGITVNPLEIEHAKRVYGIELWLQDAHYMDLLADASYDCVYAREVIEHLVAPFIGLCEINRVLAMGGHLLAHLPNAGWIREDSHYSCMDESQMKEMLRKTLFTVVSIGTTPVGQWYLARKTGSVT